MLFCEKPDDLTKITNAGAISRRMPRHMAGLIEPHDSPKSWTPYSDGCMDARIPYSRFASLKNSNPIKKPFSRFCIRKKALF